MICKIIISIFTIMLAISFGQVGKVSFNKARLVPKLLNYQGYLTDTLGVPITDDLDMTFKIFDAVSSGNELWFETQSNVPIERGVFSVILGETTLIPDSVFSDFTNTWLELILEGPQTLTPRTRITSVGYAYTSTYSDTAEYAKNAATDNDWTISGNDIYSAVSGNVGIGITSPSYKLHVNGHTGIEGNLDMNSNRITGVRNLDIAQVEGYGVRLYSHDYYAINLGGSSEFNYGPVTAYSIKMNMADVSGYGWVWGVDNQVPVAALGKNGNMQLAGNLYVVDSIGIGSSPTQELDVNGNMRLTGALYDGNNEAGTNGQVLSTTGSIIDWVDTPADNDWTISGNVLYPAGSYGLSMRSGNVMHGTNDSTHVNFGVACTTGASGQNNEFCTVSGGEYNAANGFYTTVSGGYNNIASGSRATIGGGQYNTTSGWQTTVGGGEYNTASWSCATVTGGSTNSADSGYAFVGGGRENNAGNTYATVSGGWQNTASGERATVSGGWRNNAIARYATVGGGTYNYASDQSATVSGGHADTSSGWCATVSGGYGNIASNDYATVSGGYDNAASNSHTTISGGRNNNAIGSHATVGGGRNNSASSGYTMVGGGYNNTASGTYATVGGGQDNLIAGDYSVIPGGYADTIAATADYSYLFGINSNLNEDSTFMVDMPYIRFGDESSGYEFPTTDGSADQFMVTNGSGQLTWDDDPSPSNWIVTTDSVLYTNNYWGIARGSAGNVLYGDSTHTHINLGVACVTGFSGQNYLYCTVGGGRLNKASYWYATVSGGYNNNAAGYAATVSGGTSNSANIQYATVGGGFLNTASDTFATVGGGNQNMATGNRATVGGGRTNIASGWYTTIGGGWSNNVAGYAATVSGGVTNSASSYYAFVGGGINNKARGNYSVISGGGGFNAIDSNSALGEYAVIGGGRRNVATGYAAVVGGGRQNTADSVYSTVGGGIGNTTSNKYATIGGGYFNNASGTYATVDGGYGNSADTIYATVGGGKDNIATGYSATVGGGYDNRATYYYATVGGGYKNFASDRFATVAGGFSDTAAAYCSFATNHSTKVNASDTNSAAFTTSHTTADNQVRAANFSTGTMIFTMDHPSDPMNKILNQYAIGSSEAMLIYSGSIVLDANGRATVDLPDYFDDINKNPRIQLTGVGTSDVYVAEDITENHFIIGGKPNTKVYWEVTGERTDIHAEIARVQTPVEQQKTGDLIGHSLDDDALIGIYDGLQQKKPGHFAFRTDEGRRVHEQIKRVVGE